MSVFVTVGSTEFDFLIGTVCSQNCLSALRDKGVVKLVLQIGSGRLQPTVDVEGLTITYFRYKDSLREDFEKADWIISHAGAGSCLEALELKKPLLVVVNDTLLNNHQTELADQLSLEHFIKYTTVSSLCQAICDFRLDELKTWPEGDAQLFCRWLDKRLGFV